MATCLSVRVAPRWSRAHVLGGEVPESLRRRAPDVDGHVAPEHRSQSECRSRPLSPHRSASAPVWRTRFTPSSYFELLFANPDPTMAAARAGDPRRRPCPRQAVVWPTRGRPVKAPRSRAIALAPPSPDRPDREGSSAARDRSGVAVHPDHRRTPPSRRRLAGTIPRRRVVERRLDDARTRDPAGERSLPRARPIGRRVRPRRRVRESRRVAAVAPYLPVRMEHAD